MLSWLQRVVHAAQLHQDRSEQYYERFCRRMRRERRLIPDDLGLRYEALELEADDGREIAGWLVLPPEGADCAHPGTMAVLHHHFGGQKATTLPWLDFFARNGIPALAIDGRDHGGSYAPRVGRGRFGERAKDLHCACDELRARGARKLLVVGQSQGAAVAIKAAGERHDVAAVVLDSGPAAAMTLASWTLARSLAPHEDALARAFLFYRILRSESSAGYVSELVQNLWRLRGIPLLWIHSSTDQVIPGDLRPLGSICCVRAKGRGAR